MSYRSLYSLFHPETPSQQRKSQQNENFYLNTLKHVTVSEPYLGNRAADHCSATIHHMSWMSYLFHLHPLQKSQSQKQHSTANDIKSRAILYCTRNRILFIGINHTRYQFLDLEY